MIIYEIEKPGTWIKDGNTIINSKILRLIDSLIESFYELNISLNLFNEEKIRNKLYRENERIAREFDYKEKQIIEDEVKLNYTEKNLFEKYDEIHLKTEIIYKRRKWSSGQIPSAFSNPLVFIHARTFLFALDNFERLLAVLSNEEGAPSAELNKEHKLLRENFPNLREVRNSAHHQEDRVRQLSRKKTIDLKPINNNFIYAPYGGVIITNSLNGTKYGWTLSDGNYGEVDVSEQSLRITGEILQNVLNLFIWIGKKRHLPE